MTFDEKLELMRDAYESGIEDAKKNYEHEPINWKGVFFFARNLQAIL